MIRIRTLGGLSVEKPGVVLSGAAVQRSRAALLAAIASGGEVGISRDKLLAIFWPESDTDRARGALKQAVFALRRDLGEPDVIVGVEQLQLNPLRITSDLAEFDLAVRDGDLVRAFELYQGAFLDGLHLGGAEFGQWRDGEQQRIAARYRGALEQLTRQSEAEGDLGASVRWWRALAAIDPYSAAVAISLMRALVRAGDQTAALQHAAVHSALVRADLDADADARVHQLAEDIRRELRSDDASTKAAPSSASMPSDVAVGETGLSSQAIEPGHVALSAGHADAEHRHRSRWRTFAGVMTAGVICLAILGAFLPFAPTTDSVDVAVDDSGGAGAPSNVAAEVASQLVKRIPLKPLRPAFRVRPQYRVIVSVHVHGDSVDFSARVLDDATEIAATTPVSVAPSATQRGMQELGDQVAIVLQAHRAPVFARWGLHAALPTRWDSFRSFETAIEEWAPPKGNNILARLDSVAASDTTAAAPLVLKSYILSVNRAYERSDSLMTSIARSSRRRGAWDRAMMEVLRAWNRGDWADAHTASHRLLEVVPSSEWALVAAAASINVGRPREALLWLERVPDDIEWPRRWTRVLTNQGWIAAGDFESALTHAKTQLLRAPDDGFNQQLAVKALAGLGRGREVESFCRQSLAHRLTYQPCEQAAMELRGHGHVEDAKRVAAAFLQAVRATDTTTPRGYRDVLTDLSGDVGDWATVRQALRGERLETMDQSDIVNWTRAEAAFGHRASVAQGAARITERGPYRWMYRAEFAALLGDRDSAVALVGDAFRHGYERAFALRIFSGLDGLKGYAPFDSLVRPLDDEAHLATVARRR